MKKGQGKVKEEIMTPSGQEEAIHKESITVLKPGPGLTPMAAARYAGHR